VTTPPFRPAAFLVDLDGVLVCSLEVHVDAYRMALKNFGFALPPAAHALIAEGHQRETVLSEAGVPSSLLDVVAQGKEDAFQALVRSRGLPPAKGAHRFLRALRAARCPVAVVSNSASAKLCVTAMGWSHAVHSVVGATDVANRKPDPEPYHSAAAQLGLRPEQCVAVEDSPTGVAAARAAGAFVVGIGAGVSPSAVDLWGSDLDDLPLTRWLSLSSSFDTDAES